MRRRLAGLLAVSAFIGLAGCGCGRSLESNERHGQGGGSSDAASTGGTIGSSDAGGACDSAEQYIQTVPFRLTAASDAGAGEGAGGAGGVGGEASGCTRVGPSTVCSGSASSPRVGAFVFGDGSTLTWAPYSDHDLPAPAIPIGTSVWIEYGQASNDTGSYDQTISIRASAEGEMLYVGTNRPDAVVDVTTVFGVPTLLDPSCRGESSRCVRQDCIGVFEERFDAVVETEPVQRIPFGVVTRVHVPNGTFDVFWKNATDVVWQTAIMSRCDSVECDLRDFAALRVEN